MNILYGFAFYFCILLAYNFKGYLKCSQTKADLIKSKVGLAGNTRSVDFSSIKWENIEERFVLWIFLRNNCLNFKSNRYLLFVFNSCSFKYLCR